MTVLRAHLPDRRWHFQVQVPRSSSVGPEAVAAPELQAPRSLAVLRVPSVHPGHARLDAPAEIEILGAVVEREIDPADWLEASPWLTGAEVVSRSHARAPSGVRGDVVATFRRGDAPWAGRFFAAKWGARLFAVACRAPLDEYPSLAEDFAIAVQSFAPLDQEGVFAEVMRPQGGATPVPWKLVVPESWSVQPGRSQDEVAAFQADNLRAVPVEEDDGEPPPAGDEGPPRTEDELVGKLSFAILARSVVKRPREVANIFLEAIQEYGLEVAHADFVEEPARQRGLRSWLLESPVLRGDVPGEVRCRVLQHDRVWAVAGVLSPRREDDLIAWMQNKRALDVVTSSLKIKA